MRRSYQAIRELFRRIHKNRWKPVLSLTCSPWSVRRLCDAFAIVAVRRAQKYLKRGCIKLRAQLKFLLRCLCLEIATSLRLFTFSNATPLKYVWFILRTYAIWFTISITFFHIFSLNGPIIIFAPQEKNLSHLSHVQAKIGRINLAPVMNLG